MTLAFDLGGRTHIGKRDRNEDQFVIARIERALSVQTSSIKSVDSSRIVGGHSGWLMVVADGMGGMGGGDLASATVVQSLLKQAVNSIDWLDGAVVSQEATEARLTDVARGLVAAVQHCKQVLTAKAGQAGGTVGMGSTLTAAYLVRDHLLVVHAGDSRAYLIRGGAMRLLTRDHTVADHLVKRGAMDAADAEKSHWRHLLYNVVGTAAGSSVTPDVVYQRLHAGDVVMLCSDGMVKSVPDAAIRSIAANHESAQSAADALVERSLHDGEQDNVTVVVARASKGSPKADSSTVLRRR